MDSNSSGSKKQILIFVSVAFVLPYALGILMSFGYYRGIDLSVFPSTQMFYPAAGVMLTSLITRKGDPLIPKRFFIGFLIITTLLLLCALASITAPKVPWNSISQYVIMIGSIVLLMLLFMENKDKRIAYGLKGGCWKATSLIVLIYLFLYFSRTAIAYIIDGEAQSLIEIVKNPLTWTFILAIIPFNYIFSFTAFLGEEYGWRYYLQPVLQKRLGMVKGIFVLGIVWGLWHLPINFFYYTSPSVGVISVAGQLITCITLGVFYGWAYLKTDNIWVVVILHYINNNLVPVVTGEYSADVLQNQEAAWGDVLFSLIVNTLLFMGFILTKYYKDYTNRLPTLVERADQHQRDILEQSSLASDKSDMS